MSARNRESAAPPRVQPGDGRHTLASARGTLVLVGGALEVDGAAMRSFVDLVLAQPDPMVVGFTSASADPAASAVAWRKDLHDAGLPRVDIPILDRSSRRFEAHDQEVAAAIDASAGVFLGGGDQVKLVATLAGTQTCAALKRLFIRGGTVCGTSAGAAALTELTMAGGEVDEEGNLVEQYLGPGLGLLGHRTVIDTHFSQRRRLQRLFLVVAENPTLMGLGIDENTALVVRGSVGCVVGAGGVTFVDGERSVRFDNAGDLEVARQLTVSALRVGIVGSRYELDLVERELSVLVNAAAGAGAPPLTPPGARPG